MCREKNSTVEYHDLCAVIDDVVDDAISRNCDVVIGRVAAELSRQSKLLYGMLDEPGPAAIDDDDAEWLYDPDPLWLTWMIYIIIFILGCGAVSLWDMWL